MGVVEGLESAGAGGCAERLSRRLLAEGVHPVTLLPLLARDGEPHQCGGCDRVYVRRSGGRTFVKCARAGGRRHGPDVPADLPACAAFVSRGDVLNPYAALAPGIPAPHRSPITA